MELNLSQLFLVRFIIICILVTKRCSGKELKEFTTELCLWETFKPECSNNEIVFINYAKYGRMNIGKCLSQSEIDALGVQSKDHRYFGCYNNVAAFVGRKCFLETHCEMKVGDLEKLQNTACGPGLKMYLEVGYSCLPVLDGLDKCHVFASSHPRYMLVSSTSGKVCGSSKSPMVIEAPKGQKIKITLVTLNESLPDEGQNGILCQEEAAVIVEKKHNTNVSLCRAGFFSRTSRQSYSKNFVSKENLLNIVFNSHKINDRFLMAIKAEGCLDIIPPEDTWLKRNNDDIVLGCYSSKQTWYLRCENGHWVGTIGNCSNLDLGASVSGKIGSEETDNLKMNISPIHQTLIIIAISGFGVVMCLTIVCAGLICLKRLNSKDAKKQTYYNVGPNVQNSTAYKRSVNQTLMEAPAISANTGFNESFIYRDRVAYAGSGPVEDERYQVLDKEEVAKEAMQFN